ncbi:MAG: hypothetical protein EBT97_09780, partial [Actinobacteria bacterium]|nr:hypothetical protein [Actinomycetota bacterium]
MVMKRTAAPTASYLRLESVLKPIKDALMRASRRSVFSFDRAVPVADADADALRVAIDAALPLLDIRMNDPKRRLTSKLNTRLRNFRKMLTQMRDAPNGEALGSVLASMSGKTTDAWQKYLEYSGEALEIVRALDEEEMGAYSVGAYSVHPFNTGRGDWDDDKFDTLRFVLKQGSHLLSQYGMGRFVGGAVLAYPTTYLPPSAGSGGGNTLAMYRRRDDIMWLAAGGGNPHRILQSFIHETGHRVYWMFLGNRGRAAWEEYFEGDTGTPDVDAVINAWEAWASAPEREGVKGDWMRVKYGRNLAHWINHLKETGQDDLLMWTEIVLDKVGVDENLDPYTGAPKRGAVPALDQVIAKRSEVRAFLTPVTSYSATEAGELFAEAFAHYVVDGPNRLHPKLRSELRRALPILKVGSSPLM